MLSCRIKSQTSSPPDNTAHSVIGTTVCDDDDDDVEVDGDYETAENGRQGGR